MNTKILSIFILISYVLSLKNVRVIRADSGSHVNVIRANSGSHVNVIRTNSGSHANVIRLNNGDDDCDDNGVSIIRAHRDYDYAYPRVARVIRAQNYYDDYGYGYGYDYQRAHRVIRSHYARRVHRAYNHGGKGVGQVNQDDGKVGQENGKVGQEDGKVGQEDGKVGQDNGKADQVGQVDQTKGKDENY
jgi:hypothetical protein